MTGDWVVIYGDRGQADSPWTVVTARGGPLAAVVSSAAGRRSARRPTRAADAPAGGAGPVLALRWRRTLSQLPAGDLEGLTDGDGGAAVPASGSSCFGPARCPWRATRAQAGVVRDDNALARDGDFGRRASAAVAMVTVGEIDEDVDADDQGTSVSSLAMRL